MGEPIDAEFEEVRPIRGAVYRIIGGLVVFGFAFWQGLETESHTRTLFTVMATTALAETLRALWSIARTVRDRRRAQASSRTSQLLDLRGLDRRIG
jgi:hypothetical protein